MHAENLPNFLRAYFLTLFTRFKFHNPAKAYLCGLNFKIKQFNYEHS
jgi:hypothetical protein